MTSWFDAREWYEGMAEGDDRPLRSRRIGDRLYRRRADAEAIAGTCVHGYVEEIEQHGFRVGDQVHNDQAGHGRVTAVYGESRWPIEFGEVQVAWESGHGYTLDAKHVRRGA